MSAVMKRDEVLVVGWHFRLSWPVANVFGSGQTTHDLESDLVSVLDANGHGVESLTGDAYYPFPF